MLTKYEYGEYGILKSTINNFLIFATMGIGLTTTKYISELKIRDKKSASSILGTSLLAVLVLGIFIAISISLFAKTIALNYLGDLKYASHLYIVSLILLLSAVNGVQLGALLGFQNYKNVSISNMLQGVLLFFGLTIGAYTHGVMGVMYGNLIALIFLSFIIYYLLFKEYKNNGIKPSLSTWKESLKKIYKFAIPASLSTLIVAPTIWLLNTILVEEENGYVELGMYSAVVVFTMALQMINGSLNKVLLPIFLSEETKNSPKKEFLNYFSAWYVSIVLGLILMVFPEIVSMILGNKYSYSELQFILPFALLSTLIIANRQGISRDLIMQNKMWLSVFSMGQWAITTYIAFGYLKHLGAVGFSISFFIGYAINYLLFLPFFIKKKIVDKRVFYNYRIFLIWTVIILIFLNSIYNQTILYRVLIAIALVFSLFYLMHAFYKNYINKII